MRTSSRFAFIWIYESTDLAQPVQDVAFNWLVPIWRELWVPIAILVGAPLATGAPWFGNLLTVDLGQWLFALAILLLATGVTRVTPRGGAQRPRSVQSVAEPSAAG